MEVVVRFVRWGVVWGAVFAGFVWWSWLWHQRLNFVRGRCDFAVATLREVRDSDGWWPEELVEKVEDLVNNGWGMADV